MVSRRPLIVTAVHQVESTLWRAMLADGSDIDMLARSVSFGCDVSLSPDIRIGLPGKPVDEIIVGDHVRLFGGIIAPYSFKCGDYTTIHDGVWCYGRKACEIGHNGWFGMRCTLDCEGGFRVGNGFGAGQDTHLWSHIGHGDVAIGCRFLAFNEFSADDDVWFVGRCTSSPEHHEAKSVALTESNVTTGMKMNHIYGGNPARDLTEKIGAPYIEMTVEKTKKVFADKLAGYHGQVTPTLLSRFDVVSRTYEKQNDPDEVALMRFLLPAIKFIPAMKS